MNVWQRYRRLPQQRRRLLRQAMLTVGLARVIGVHLPLGAATSLLAFVFGRRRREGIDLKDVIWAVEAAARRIPGAHCLPQALAAQALLRSLGYAAELRIGVRRAHAGLSAHAWLEASDGSVLLGDANSPAAFSVLRHEPRHDPVRG